MLDHQLKHIEAFTKIMEDIDADIEKKTASMDKQLQLLDEIPGIGKKVRNGCLRK